MRPNRAKVAGVALLLTVVCAARTAFATVPGLVDDTTSAKSNLFGINGSLTDVGYSPFTLTSPATISDGTALMEGSVAVSSYYLVILNNNAGTPGSTVLGTSSGGTGLLSSSSFSFISYSFSLPVSLPAGSYYLEMNTTAPSGEDIWNAASTVVNTGTDGNATSPLYYANGNGHANVSGAFIFSLSGTASVPEPTSLATISLASLGLLRRRRTR